MKQKISLARKSNDTYIEQMSLMTHHHFSPMNRKTNEARKILSVKNIYCHFVIDELREKKKRNTFRRVYIVLLVMNNPQVINKNYSSM